MDIKEIVRYVIQQYQRACSVDLVCTTCNTLKTTLRYEVILTGATAGSGD